MEKKYFIGIDIGGTKTAVAITDSKMNIIAKKLFPTKSELNCQGIVKNSYAVLQQLAKDVGINFEDFVSVGIACPGPLDLKSGTIINIPTLGYKNEPLLDYFKELFKLPAALQKDTNAAVYYESILGKGKQCSSVVYITISTGIGSGLCIDSKIINGSNSCAGELGHMVVIPNGRKCACGSYGCLEAYASGTSIANIASEVFGYTLSTKDVFDLARRNETKAVDIIRNAAGLIGYATSCLCQIVDPGIVIFGGSVTKNFDLLKPYIEEAMNKYLEPIEGRKISIDLSDTDGNQTVVGAALYGKDFAK